MISGKLIQLNVITNLHNEHDILQTYLMTYEDIPKDAIRLIDKKDMI